MRRFYLFPTALKSFIVSNENPIQETAVKQAVTDALSSFSSAADLQELRSAKSEHLGERSVIAQLNALMRTVPKEEKAATGKLMGQARAELEKNFKEREQILEAQQRQAQLQAETVDVTAAPVKRRLGSRHPLAQLQEEIADSFVSMGWEVAEGPELEHEWYNFDALGFDVDHPARAEADTFYVDPLGSHLLLRTHTSPVQSRALLNRDLPLYVVAPGRVYRTDELDATHTPVFTR